MVERILSDDSCIRTNPHKEETLKIFDAIFYQYERVAASVFFKEWVRAVHNKRAILF